MTERKTTRIDVLDGVGYVRLMDWMGGDLSVVRAARVSYDADWRAGEDEGSDARLVRYLMRNQHSTPFEAVEFQFEVKLPIFVARQWHRHRTWTYNELSARYRELPEEFYVPDPLLIGTQDSRNKQGREASSRSDEEARAQVLRARDACEDAFETYGALLDEHDWPRELARIVLPVAAYTHMFAKVDLWNLLRFLRLRLDPHAQREIRAYAEALQELALAVAPVSVAAWQEVVAEEASMRLMWQRRNEGVTHDG